MSSTQANGQDQSGRRERLAQKAADAEDIDMNNHVASFKATDGEMQAVPLEEFSKVSETLDTHADRLDENEAMVTDCGNDLFHLREELECHEKKLAAVTDEWNEKVKEVRDWGNEVARWVVEAQNELNASNAETAARLGDFEERLARLQAAVNFLCNAEERHKKYEQKIKQLEASKIANDRATLEWEQRVARLEEAVNRLMVDNTTNGVKNMGL
ncbi:hypothetical protein AK830_g9976 [Neonectria ditissima]|uniref:Uncharacterized protein n=1 Tax=Neonectria ditissima TaxID=78410 RepID=A0A0P7B881_9HYPO|nr:hypothetical protein AK830_g9976 [Neonectria ditissima]